MTHKSAAKLLKIYVLYVHREYTTLEIAKMLNITKQTVAGYIKRLSKMDPEYAAAIRKRKADNLYAGAHKRA